MCVKHVKTDAEKSGWINNVSWIKHWSIFYAVRISGFQTQTGLPPSCLFPVVKGSENKIVTAEKTLCLQPHLCEHIQRCWAADVHDTLSKLLVKKHLFLLSLSQSELGELVIRKPFLLVWEWRHGCENRLTHAAVLRLWLFFSFWRSSLRSGVQCFLSALLKYVWFADW